MHYDNPGPPNKRALTCLLYLNPDWKEGDGGELCLTPFLQKEKVIAPLLDRMVRVEGSLFLQKCCHGYDTVKICVILKNTEKHGVSERQQYVLRCATCAAQARLGLWLCCYVWWIVSVHKCCYLPCCKVLAAMRGIKRHIDRYASDHCSPIECALVDR